MLFINLYYAFFSSFIQAVVWLCETLHFVSPRQWHLWWKRRESQQKTFIPELRLEVQAGAC
jgi:hypothetical protein